jgi:hypothetical protein
VQAALENGGHNNVTFVSGAGGGAIERVAISLAGAVVEAGAEDGGPPATRVNGPSLGVTARVGRVDVASEEGGGVHLEIRGGCARLIINRASTSGATCDLVVDSRELAVDELDAIRVGDGDAREMNATIRRTGGDCELDERGEREKAEHGRLVSSRILRDGFKKFILRRRSSRELQT